MEQRSCEATEAALSKFQATFRGQRARKLHVNRVKQNLAWSPFVASKPQAVRDMLELAQVTSKDIVVDIGSGDGRVLIAAAQEYGAQGIGYEIDPVLVAESRNKIHEKGLQEQIQIIQQDWVQYDSPDLATPTLVTLFFLPHAAIAETLRERYPPGTKVVTYVFQIKEWEPLVQSTSVPFMTKQGSSPMFLYQIPAKKDDIRDHPNQS